MPTSQSLLSEIDAFLAAHNMAASTFGRKAVNDWGFVERVRKGGKVTLETAQKVREFIVIERRRAA